MDEEKISPEMKKAMDIEKQIDPALYRTAKQVAKQTAVLRQYRKM